METLQEQEMDLRAYLRVIYKRRWTIILVFALVMLIVTVHTFSVTPIYRATARLVIEKENPYITSMQEMMAVDATSTEYYQTQYKIIESKVVAREVIKRLNLANSEEFAPKPKKETFIGDIKASVQQTIAAWKEGITSLLNKGESKAGTAAADDHAPDAALVSAFISRIKVEPVRNSRLVDVSAEATDPAMAARIANEVVKAYIDQNLETKLQAAKDAVKWLTDRIEEERKKVEEAEHAVLAYKQEHEIITDFSSDSEKITAEKLAQLNAQVIEAESKRVEAETRYRQAMELLKSPDMIDSVPEVLSNDIIKEIKKMEVNLYNRMSELSNKYGQNHPQMQAIQAELDDLKKRKKTEAERIISSLRSEYRLASSREESLKKALNAQKSESLEMNKKAIQYSVLRRQAESSKHMYDLLIKRFKETSLVEEMKTGNIRIIDKAEPPRAPVKPNKQRNMLLAVAIGLMLGIGLAFFLDYLDNTVKMPDEVKDYLGIPYLGPIPYFDTREASGELRSHPDLITLNSPKSTASESFRGARTGILFSSPDNPPQVLMVTSAHPGEGKTLFASNLAVTMAQQDGAKAILIDCDMRRPRIHSIFNLKRETGVSSVLVGETPLTDAIISTDIPNLDVIPCGPIPPNPSELLGSAKMRSLIEELRKEYQRIIIDTPPVIAVTDSMVASSIADGVILVIRTAQTAKQMIKSAVMRLQTVNAKILGAVLNVVSTKRDHYYYYQYYYYYYDSPKDGEEKEKRKRRHHHKKEESSGALN